MNSQILADCVNKDLIDEAKIALEAGNYQQSAVLYENLINLEPENHTYYWYLGLALLLQDLVVEAQTTWLMAMMDGEPSQVESWTAELVEVLETEAVHQATQENLTGAWSIRQQIYQLLPTEIDNIIHLCLLSILLGTFTENNPEYLNLLDIFSLEPNLCLTTIKLLIELLKKILNNTSLLDYSVELIKLVIPWMKTEEEKAAILDFIEWSLAEIGVVKRYYVVAIPLGEIGISLNPNHINILFYLANFYQNIGKFEQGIKLASQFYQLLDSLPDQVYGKALVLRGFMSASSSWQQACTARQELKDLLTELFLFDSTIAENKIGAIANSSFFLPYFADRPQEIRNFHNQLATICCRNLQHHYQQLVKVFQNSFPTRKQSYLQNYSLEVTQKSRPLRIGYISHCLKSHSVGWMARWIFEHGDLENHEIFTYMACCDPVNDPVHEWYLQQVPRYYKSSQVRNLAEKIHQDEIDILVDLDSITSDIVYEVMALKPAPIQVTWLGWDASGLPTIDYYIADDFVLPADAQEYYPEKIWRLPETYIAVDGFEIAVPDLRRDQLDIPVDAVVFLSAHTGYKRHPEMIKVHMEIIKGVPGSYFLIKERTDKEGIRAFYGEIAEAVGLESDRLRFMPRTTFEAVHRANLGIADVVLDTYPYNGATTTMETLWMGLPMVTRVGEQFAARNSYTMMMNAGITEGIAWSDQEYIEWGIRLGTDKDLRQDIACRLKASRQTAPLWNGKKFTRQMEEAYQQMWQIYLDSDPNDNP